VISLDIAKREKLFSAERKAIARRAFRLMVLKVLENDKMNGYEVIRTMESLFGGNYAPSPGLVYPTLRVLEKEGLVSSEKIGGSRYYWLTDAGKKLLADRKEEIEGLLERMKELKCGKHSELKKTIERLLRTIYVYLPEMGEAKEAQVVEILEGVRNKIISIMEGEK